MKKFFRIASIFLILASFIGCPSPEIGKNPGEEQKTGSIVGKVVYENDNVTDYSGIQVSLISTNGLMAVDYCESRGIATNARKVEDIIFTDSEGNYNFKDVPEGVYTICASSDNSTKKAVLTNVTVTAGRTITASDLGLTATGSITGKITIDGNTDGVLGLDVFIAGTSFVAKVGSDGNYEISNIPAKKGYVLCVQKEKYTTTIKNNLEVKGDDTVKIDDVNLLSKDWEEGTVEQENPTFKWLGSFETEPEDPNLYEAYFNTEDGCSYIWNGEDWDLLSQAGKDGVDGKDGKDGVDGKDGKDGVDGKDGQDGKDGSGEDEEYYFKGSMDLENFLPEKTILKVNQYSNETPELNYALPFSYQIPNVGDKITLELEFVSNKDIESFTLSFADNSVAANWWLDLSGGEEKSCIIDNIKAGELVKINHTFDVYQRPLQNVALHMAGKTIDFANSVELTIEKSKIVVTSLSDQPNFISASKDFLNPFICTATEEGIKFTGNLLSNIESSQAMCTITVQDVTNGIIMTRNYVLDSMTWEEWEMIYPLVEKDKQYHFEVKMEHNANIISMQDFYITAIGGLGEYKVENYDTYEVTLSEDKKTLSRTPQDFTDNPNVQDKIIDCGTKYTIYSNDEAATEIWSGIWRHGSIHWASKTDQDCDLTSLETWLSYEWLNSSLKGRKMGVLTETHLKIAGYTYNDTTTFKLNDEKLTFFDWDNEEENKLFILYKNPVTGEYYDDVPGTSLYYIKEKLDENGNIIFAEKDADGAIEVYGQLISIGEKIYEPVYVPTKIEGYNFTGSWEANYGYQTIKQIKFPYNSNDFYYWTKGEVIPVILSPEFKPDQYKVNFVDENGNEILDSIVTKSENFTLPEIPYKENYFCNYWQGGTGYYNAYSDVTLTEPETTFVADYRLEYITLNFCNEDGSVWTSRYVYNGDYYKDGDGWRFYDYGDHIGCYNVYIPYETPSKENYIFDYWKCETDQTYYPGEELYSLNKGSVTINFYPEYHEKETKVANFYDENGSLIETITVVEDQYDSSWNQIQLPSIFEKDGYISIWRNDYDNSLLSTNEYVYLYSSTTNFYPEYYEKELRIANFYDADGNFIETITTIEDSNNSYWNQIQLPSISEKDGYISVWRNNYDNSLLPPNEYVYLYDLTTNFYTKYISEAYTIDSIDTNESIKTYTLYCEQDSSYSVSWMDSYQGDSELNSLMQSVGITGNRVDIKVSVFSATGSPIISSVDSGYTDPQIFTANETGYYTIQVEPYSSGSTGYFAIKFEQL